MVPKVVLLVFFSDRLGMEPVLDFLTTIETDHLDLVKLTPTDLYPHICTQLKRGRRPGAILLITDNLADDAMIALLYSVLQNDPRTRDIPCSMLCSDDQAEYREPGDELSSNPLPVMRCYYFRNIADGSKAC